ncbi:MAG: ABC transporter ATP-binding protein [Bacteroidales bacterium]|nr:ABC transporter ATP-binding protein [Bacteroidales bacterium]
MTAKFASRFVVVRVFGYLRRYPKAIVLNVMFNILAVLFNLGTFVMIVPFVELLFGSATAPEPPAQFSFSQEYLSEWMQYNLAIRKSTLGLWPCLLLVSAVYLFFNLLSNLMRYAALFSLSTIRNGIVGDIRADIYHRITLLPVSFFNSQRQGDILSRMSNDLADVEWSVVSTLQSLVKDPVNIVVFCAALVFISPKLFVLFLLVLPVAVWLIAKIGASLKRNSMKGQNRLGALFASLQETLSNMATIKAFEQERLMEERFKEANANYASSMVKVAWRRELSSPLSEVLGTVALVAILVIGGAEVLQGFILPSVFILFVILFARLIPPVQAVVKAYNSLLKGSASAARIFEVIDADEKIVEKADAVCISGFNDAIEFRNVGFSYVDGTEVLHDVSFTIKKGQTVALVGPSGAGKTTIADLLPRFYDVTGGSILVDGRNIDTLNINSLRRLIGIVPQDSLLFNDTVANNIAFGQSDYTQEAVVEVARLSCADEFIRNLPEGYATMVGDKGTLLSGGQRQRLAIARALFKNPQILILDEATSALDAQSEKEVQQALATLMKGRTSLVIAHRLSTIQDADNIIVLDRGRIVQQGTHHQLMAEEGGLYHHLATMQQL